MAWVALYHEENFVNLSDKPFFSVLSVFSACTFLTSGSPSGMFMSMSAGGGISFSHRNCGPLNQSDMMSLLAPKVTCLQDFPQKGHISTAGESS